MTVTLVLTDEIADEIDQAARLAVETAGVLLASVACAPSGDVRILGREMRWVDEAAYFRRDTYRLSIASEGYVPALAEGERICAMCLWVHTHPGKERSPRPSAHDHAVDVEIADLFRLRSGSPYYGTLIFSPRVGGLAFTGTLQEGQHSAIAIDRFWQPGDRWRLTRAFDSNLSPLAPLFDRNIRAFGETIQHVLGDLKIAIVGCGGTGSAVAEQLVRLGVRHLVIIDPDTLAESNLTRVYGASPSDIGRAKVDVLKTHLTRIAPELHCEAVPAMVTFERTARALIGSDIVFGCTDDNAGRMILSRLSTYLLTPVIDCGVLLTSGEGGELRGIDGRITTLTPGQACLICRGRIDLKRAAAELLTPQERVQRENEGYAPALGRAEPAVVAYTTAVAATAVTELLERLIGYGPEPRPGEVLLRYHEREVSTNREYPREGHYCHRALGKWGMGAAEPFLEQTWPCL